MKNKGIIGYRYNKDDMKNCWDVIMFPPHEIVSCILKDDTFILEYRSLSALSCHAYIPLTPRQQEIMDEYSRFIVEHPNGKLIFKEQYSQMGMEITVSKFLKLQSKMINGKENTYTP